MSPTVTCKLNHHFIEKKKQPPGTTVCGDKCCAFTYPLRTVTPNDSRYRIFNQVKIVCLLKKEDKIYINNKLRCWS